MTILLALDENDPAARLIYEYAKTTDGWPLVLAGAKSGELSISNKSNTLTSENVSKVILGRDLTLGESGIIDRAKIFHVARRGESATGAKWLEALVRCGVPLGGAGKLLYNLEMVDAGRDGRLEAFSINDAVDSIALAVKADPNLSSDDAKNYTISLNGPLNRCQRRSPGARDIGYFSTSYAESPAKIAAATYGVDESGHSGSDILRTRLEATKWSTLSEAAPQAHILVQTNKITALALPNNEAGLVKLAIERIVAVPGATAKLYETCGRLVVWGTGTGLEHQLTDLAKRNAPLAARKVKSANVSLFLPFHGESTITKDIADQASQEADYEKQSHYFLPHLHGLLGLCGTNSDRCLYSRAQSDNGMQLNFAHPSYEPNAVNLKGMATHALTKNSHIVELKLICPADLTLDTLWDMTATLRRVQNIYETKAQDENGNWKPVQWGVGEKFQDILSAVLNRLGLKAENYAGDDRAFVLQSTIIDGAPPDKGTIADDTLRIAAERQSSVDGWGETRPYSKAFSEREFQTAFYDRFAQFASLLSATDHSFSYLGFSAPPIADEQISFAEKEIHTEHMNGAYRRMVIYALTVRTELDRFEKLLDQAARDESDPSSIRKLHSQFVNFVNLCWRETLSSQVQGRELFTRIHCQMGIPARLAKLEANFAELDRVETIKRDEVEGERDKRRVLEQTVLGFVGTWLGLVIAIMGVVVPMLELSDDSQKVVAGQVFWILPISIVVAVVFYAIIRTVVGPVSLWCKRVLNDWRKKTHSP